MSVKRQFSDTREKIRKIANQEFDSLIVLIFESESSMKIQGKFVCMFNKWSVSYLSSFVSQLRRHDHVIYHGNNVVFVFDIQYLRDKI